MKKSKDVFLYYNRNPKKKELEDCVCRAISTATGLNYYAVENLLNLSAYLNHCDKLCVCCYHKLLEGILCYHVRKCRYGETVKDVALRHKDKKVIIRIEQHLTCAIYGKVSDIWNCADKIVDCYWIVPS